MKRGGGPLVLAVDIGSSRVKSGLFDSRGRLLPASFASQDQRVRYSPDGGAEIAAEDLRRAFEKAVQRSLAGLPEKTARVTAVGVSCFWHSLLGLDEDGRPLTPVYTWADSRSREQARRLRGQMSEEEVHARTGCMLRSSFWPAKLLWIRESSPRLFDRVRRWTSPAEWLQNRFCGGAAASLSMASASGLLDTSTLKWDRPLLDCCAVSEERLGFFSEQPATVEGQLADRFPGLQGALWHPPIGDGAAGNLGSGATEEGVAALNLGTSSALRILKASGPPRAPFGLFCYRLDRDRFLVGGASSNSGNLRQWCLRQLRLGDEAAAAKALARRREPRHGLLLLPFWTAERAPFWEEETPGIIYGLGQSTSALDILQAAEESGFYRLAMILERIQEAEGRRLRILVSGGAARSASTLRRLADALGQPVQGCTAAEASLRGAAVWALEKTGVSVRPPQPRPVVLPDPANAQAHLQLRARQREFQTRLEAASNARGI